jgi:biopolymer transport protein ExbD
MSITTDQVLKIDKSIALPVATEAKKRENDIKNQVIVNVDWDTALGKAEVRYGAIICDPVSQLVDHIQPAKEANPQLKLIIRGDALTPAVEIQKVIEQLAAAGIDDISLSGTNRN